MESFIFMASGTLAMTKIIQKCLDVSTAGTAASLTREPPLILSNDDSERHFQTRTYFNIDKTHYPPPVIDVHELQTASCNNTDECTVRFGDGFSCILIARPVQLTITIDGVDKKIVYDADINSNVASSNQSLDCKRCVLTGQSRRLLKCNALTSVAVGSAVYSPQTGRFNAHWVCESLYPDMFSKDSESGDITISHACGAAENRGQLVHEETGLSWDEHYKRYGRYDPADSLVCECYPFPFKPEDVPANRSLYSDNIIVLPSTSTCRRSTCAPGRPHLSEPESCECPRGYVSCPVIGLNTNEQFHRRLCWGSYVRNHEGHPMPTCVRDPCLPRGTLDASSGMCVSNKYEEVKAFNEIHVLPKVTWSIL